MQLTDAVAGQALGGRVPCVARGGHGTPVHRRVHRHEDRRGLLLPGLRRGAVPQRVEVRFALRGCSRSSSRWPRTASNTSRPLDPRSTPRRSPVRRLRLPPGARLYGERAIWHAHRSALRIKLGLPDLAGTSAPDRDLIETRAWEPHPGRLPLQGPNAPSPAPSGPPRGGPRCFRMPCPAGCDPAALTVAALLALGALTKRVVTDQHTCSQRSVTYC